jgi:hypothetical protein
MGRGRTEKIIAFNVPSPPFRELPLSATKFSTKLEGLEAPPRCDTFDKGYKASENEGYGATGPLQQVSDVLK